MWQFWANIIPVVFLLALGYGVGRYRERRHIRALVRREREFADMRVSNLKAVPEPETVQRAMMVTGEVVIATDYFKSFAARLRNIVGGEVRAFETLMNRARREATLRMLAEARRAGAAEVWNVRLETSNIRSGGRRQTAVSVEVFAFGTAVVRA